MFLHAESHQLLQCMFSFSQMIWLVAETNFGAHGILLPLAAEIPSKIGVRTQNDGMFVGSHNKMFYKIKLSLMGKSVLFCAAV